MRAVDVQWLMTPESPSVDDLLAELVNRPAWHRQANCRGMGTKEFFPERGRSIETATAVCDGCTVRQECHEEAMAYPDTQGIWAV